MLRRSVERQPVHLITEVSEEVGENLCGWSFFVSPPVTKLFPEILRDPRDLRDPRGAVPGFDTWQKREIPHHPPSKSGDPT